MVAAARKDRENTERKNEQLRTQLNDMELLLSSHQEQLAELKNVLQQLNMNCADPDTATNSSTPSTPALATRGEAGKVMDTLRIAVSMANADDIPPGPPTSFSNLLSPVLRTDLQSYEDFRSLMDIAKKSAPSSRVNSGSYGSLHIPGLGTGQNLPSNGSTISLSMMSTQNSSVNTNSPGAGTPNIAPPSVPLKETKFYKRALTEDIEPTLRLDTAPGLSWLARRTVINSMCEGSLVVEPMPASIKMSVFSCSLCGENRTGGDFTRTHRFRTSESENAQRYPLCNYCLNRVRASCDYLGFLRMVKDGHWRTDGNEAEKLAWEESVRLRERMFWARIGGGVVPAFTNRDSPRSSMEDIEPNMPLVASLTPGLNPKSSVNSTKENSISSTSTAKKPFFRPDSVARTSSHLNDEDDNWETAKSAPFFDDASPSPNASKLVKLSPKQSNTITLAEPLNHTSLRESLKPRPRSRAASYEKERVATPESNADRIGAALARHDRSPSPSSHQTTNDQGLKITIPGGFDF